MSDSDGYASPDWEWDEKYHAELMDLYNIFTSYEYCLFGHSFHQFSSYANFVAYTQNSTICDSEITSKRSPHLYAT